MLRRYLLEYICKDCGRPLQVGVISKQVFDILEGPVYEVLRHHSEEDTGLTPSVFVDCQIKEFQTRCEQCKFGQLHA